MPALIKRVYVWEFPVRLYHWVNFACVIALCATGYLIGSPIAIQRGREASFSYWFGTVRFVHFVAAFTFFFNFLFRIYWGFAGNQWARWRNFLPLTKRQWREMKDVVAVDILQRAGAPIPSIGHNALAGLTYFLTFLAFLLQCATGFGMYAAMSNSLLPRLFAWVPALMGGDMAARHLHHAMMWFFILFSMVHVYLVFYHDYVESRGVISSMASGWKFVEAPDDAGAGD